MPSARALPDVVSHFKMDTTGLKKAGAEAEVVGAQMGRGMGKASSASQLLAKDIQGLQRDTAKALPGLGGMSNSLMGIPAPALAAAAALGGMLIVGKAIIDISDRWEAAQKGLEQATDAVGASYNNARDYVDKFIDTNRRYVKNQAEVADAYAGLIRSGIGSKKAQEDLNLALDLASIKNKSLAEAASALTKVEMGKGKALIELGINMKDYPVLTESATQANKKLELATAAVHKATLAHTAAVHAHGAKSAQAKATADALAAANAKLAEAHNYAAERAAASAEIHELLHQKLDGGRKTTSDLTQAQNNLSNVWQTFAQRVGPGLVKALTAAIEVLGHVADFIGVVLAKSLELQDKMGQAFGWIRDRIQEVLEKLHAVADFLSHIKVPDVLGKIAGGAGGILSAIAGRQGGGPVLPGRIYKVGEAGPEILKMGQQGGTIIPGGTGSGGGGGGGQVILQPIVYGPMTPQLQRMIDLDLSERLRRLPLGQRSGAGT